MPQAIFTGFLYTSNKRNLAYPFVVNRVVIEKFSISNGKIVFFREGRAYDCWIALPTFNN